MEALRSRILEKEGDSKMNLRKPLLFIALLSLTAFVSQSVAQSAQGQNQNNPPAQSAPSQNPSATGKEPAAPKLNPEEEASYQKFLKLPAEDPQALIKSGEEFLKKFPDSRYREAIYSRMTAAYLRLGNEDKLVETGEKALALNPDDVDVLPVMALALPRRYDPNTLDSQQLLEKAQNYAQHAIELLQKLPKPASLTDEQFTRARNEKLAMCHSGLGLVSYYQNNLPRMAGELEQAIQLEAEPDPVDQFLLGFAYLRLGRYADAATTLEKCAAQNNPIQDRCRTLLEQAKKLAASAPKSPQP